MRSRIIATLQHTHIVGGEGGRYHARRATAGGRLAENVVARALVGGPLSFRHHHWWHGCSHELVVAGAAPAARVGALLPDSPGRSRITTAQSLELLLLKSPATKYSTAACVT